MRVARRSGAPLSVSAHDGGDEAGTSVCRPHSGTPRSPHVVTETRRTGASVCRQQARAAPIQCAETGRSRVKCVCRPCRLVRVTVSGAAASPSRRWSPAARCCLSRLPRSFRPPPRLPPPRPRRPGVALLGTIKCRRRIGPDRHNVIRHPSRRGRARGSAQCHQPSESPGRARGSAQCHPPSESPGRAGEHAEVTQSPGPRLHRRQARCHALWSRARPVTARSPQSLGPATCRHDPLSQDLSPSRARGIIAPTSLRPLPRHPQSMACRGGVEAPPRRSSSRRVCPSIHTSLPVYTRESARLHTRACPEMRYPSTCATPARLCRLERQTLSPGSRRLTLMKRGTRSND